MQVGLVHQADDTSAEHGFTIEDAFIFLSVACDAGVAQGCKPAEGFGTIARFSIHSACA